MPFEYTCDLCGKPFARKSRVKGKGAYCSTKCYHESTKSGGHVVCELCGKSVYRPKTRIERGERFCSKECRIKALAPEMVSKVCPACGETFEVPASIEDRYTVCSWECRTINYKTYSCETCGKEFQSGEKRWMPRFCSISCYRSNVGETHLEATIRRALTTLDIKFIQEGQVGRYSVDFLIPEGKVALEADGTYWHQDKARDNRKTKYLARYGWTTIRVKEKEVQTTNNVCDLIVEKLSSMPTISIDYIQPPLFDFSYEVGN